MSDSFATITCQAPLSMGFSRQEYWSGVPFPSPGHLLDPGIELESPARQVDSLPLSHQGSPEKTGEVILIASKKMPVFVLAET